MITYPAWCLFVLAAEVGVLVAVRLNRRGGKRWRERNTQERWRPIAVGLATGALLVVAPGVCLLIWHFIGYTALAIGLITAVAIITLAALLMLSMIDRRIKPRRR